MGLVVVTAPASEPITLEEAKAQCRVDGSDEDALLQIYIGAARRKAEGLMGRPIIATTFEQTLDAFPAEEIALRAPASSITSVVYVDTTGAEQTLAAELYALDATNATPWLLPALGTSWPATLDVINAVKVRFVSGWANAGAVPADIKAWLLLTVAYLFGNREALDGTGRVQEIPGRFVDSLLDPYRWFGE